MWFSMQIIMNIDKTERERKREEEKRDCIGRINVKFGGSRPHIW